MVGVELRPHRARLARAALGADAEILESDARTISAGTCRVVLLFDVLHMMPRARSGCAAGGRRRCARAGWRHSGSRGRCVSRMAVPGGEDRQSPDGARLGRLASAAGVPHGRASGANVSRGTASRWKVRRRARALPLRIICFVSRARQAESAATVPREQSA